MGGARLCPLLLSQYEHHYEFGRVDGNTGKPPGSLPPCGYSDKSSA
jgi:hypothetical protein